jgi:ribosome-interacting GTPase 1
VTGTRETRYCDVAVASRNSETKEATTATQRRGEHVSAATNKHATIEELLETVFSVWSAPRLYSEDKREKQTHLLVREDVT